MSTETEEIAVPKSIANQGDLADQAIRQKNQPSEEPANEEPAGEPEGESAQTQEQPGESESTEEQSTEGQPEGQEGQEKEEPPEKPEETFEQKYKTLKGKYDAEVPRLHSQLRAERDKSRQLEQEVATLKAKVEQQGAKDDQPQDTDYNPEDFEDFGPEFVKLAKANQDLKNMVQDLQGKLDNVSSEVSSSRKEAGESEFMSTLASKVDNWEEQNTDPEFIGWLQNVEPLTGWTYGDLLADAQGKNDGNRAAQLFLTFRDQSGKKYAQAQADSSQSKPKKQGFPQPTVAPPRSRSGGEPVKQEGRMFTETEIDKFYKDLAQGKISKEDADKQEQEIFKAKREGRIRRG